MPTLTKHTRTSEHSSNLLKTEFDRSKLLRIIAVIAILALATMFLVGLFAPGLQYSLTTHPDTPVDAPAFLNQLEAMVDSKLTHGNDIEVIENGDHFYETEMQAMREARHSIDIEAYIFHKGKVTDQVLEILSQRARAGVHVNLVIDALGSATTRKNYFHELKDAGGHVEWYDRLRLHNWFRTNNRTHREITVIDGTTAFVGGAGYADWWRFAVDGEPRWRDTMVRVQGDAVRAIQGTFLENWLEASGQILDGSDYFPETAPRGGTSTALVIASTPSSGGSTRARVLFQTLIATARKSIYITTPYFLPDHSMRDELVRARKRGVLIKILVPGKHDDHTLTRSSGRSAYGDLLKAGAEIWEYEASMIHAKVTIADGSWSVVGSTNLDNRSFGINDEINVAVLNPEVAARLTRDFDEDTSKAKRITLQQWENRSPWERVLESAGWVLQRQE